MDDTQLEALFRSHFTRDIVGLIVGALDAAYNAASEHHVPREGSNNETFGTNVHHFKVKRLNEAFHDERLGVKCMKVKNAFQMIVGPYTVGCYSVGTSEHDDIRTSFPKNDGAAPDFVEGQLCLFAPAPSQRIDGATKFIIAHLGNPDGGLRAVYLCIPGAIRNGRISEWSYTLPLWRVDVALSLLPASLHIEETIEPPLVLLKGESGTNDAVPPREHEEQALPPIEEVPPAKVLLSDEVDEDEGRR